MGALMDLNQAREMYNDLFAKRNDLITERERINRELSGYVKMLDGLTDVFPELLLGAAAESETITDPNSIDETNLNRVGDAAGPRGKTLLGNIVSILDDEPERWFTVKEVALALVDATDARLEDYPEPSVRRALRMGAEQNRLRRSKVDGRTTAYRSVYADAYPGLPELPGDSEGPDDGASGPTETATTDGAGGDSDAFPRPHPHGRQDWPSPDRDRAEGTSVAAAI